MTDIKRCSFYSCDKDVETCVCDRGWLDLHVALIIVQLLLGSRCGIGQALMWAWSHVTLGCWAEVAYWCRHRIVTHISYHGVLFEMKAAICLRIYMCVYVCVLQRWILNGDRVKAVWEWEKELLLRSQLVHWTCRRNDMSLNISCFKHEPLKGWREQKGVLRENREQFPIKTMQQKEK